ncbi:hypothetical protein BDV34DRAFT_237322 [Aspergillus parasiticus]|uniref:Uncharacterized protein n=1 Tax=Aspergillus parasiticus TaxID=5067 RepID=A0A5N6DZG7_ASPPA|nr:hypothetical protein BDV34DRAFT_237322 [Aspergillus parasiticus]
MADSTLHFEAPLFPHYSDFLAHVTGQIRDSQYNFFLVYKGIQKTWIQDAWDYIEDNHEGRAVRKSYNTVTGDFSLKIMPTWVHNCIQPWQMECTSAWCENGLITREEFRELHTYAGTTLDLDQGPYRGSRKDPDLFILPTTCLHPCLAMESGWSEGLTEMENDMDMLLVGGNGAIKTVFIIEWRKHSDNYHVSGVVKVYKPDENGMPVQEGPDQVIFPRPADGQNQVIGVARGDIFGGTPFRNRNPCDILEYSLDILREIATIALDRMGLVPA